MIITVDSAKKELYLNIAKYLKMLSIFISQLYFFQLFQFEIIFGQKWSNRKVKVVKNFFLNASIYIQCV